MKKQINSFPYGYGKELSDIEASENFKKFRPVLLRLGQITLVAVVTYFTNQASFAEDIPKPAPAPSRTPVGEAGSIVAVGVTCAAAAAAGNLPGIILAVLGCAASAAANYFKKLAG